MGEREGERESRSKENEFGVIFEVQNTANGKEAKKQLRSIRVNGGENHRVLRDDHVAAVREGGRGRCE